MCCTSAEQQHLHQTMVQDLHTRITSHHTHHGPRPCTLHPHITSVLVLKDSNSLSLGGDSYAFTLLHQLIGLPKKTKQTMHTAKRVKSHLSTPLSFVRPGQKSPYPVPKSSKYLCSRMKCGRVVETGPKTNGKQPVWISSAHTVAPSVPTPAQSSKEWERFRCLGVNRRDCSDSPPHLSPGRQCNVYLMKCPSAELRCVIERQEKFARLMWYLFSEMNTI